MQCRHRLARRGARVGLQRPPEAAVGNAISGEHRQRGLRVARSDRQRRPVAVEEASVRFDEVEDPVDVGHGAHSPSEEAELVQTSGLGRGNGRRRRLGRPIGHGDDADLHHATFS